MPALHDLSKRGYDWRNSFPLWPIFLAAGLVLLCGMAWWKRVQLKGLFGNKKQVEEEPFEEPVPMQTGKPDYQMHGQQGQFGQSQEDFEKPLTSNYHPDYSVQQQAYAHRQHAV